MNNYFLHYRLMHSSGQNVMIRNKKQQEQPNHLLYKENIKLNLLSTIKLE